MHCTHCRTHATLLSLQYNLNVLLCFDWEIFHLKGYQLHRLLSIGLFFWCHYPKVRMAYSYVIYWLTQANFSAFTPLRRNGQVWRACIAPVPGNLQRLPLHTVNHSELYGVGRPYSPPLSDIEEDEIMHVVIDTAFDPSAAKNKCFKPPCDKVLNTSWGAAERSWAEADKRVKSLKDLRNKVGVQVPVPIVLILSTAQKFLSQ